MSKPRGIRTARKYAVLPELRWRKFFNFVSRYLDLARLSM